MSRGGWTVFSLTTVLMLIYLNVSDTVIGKVFIVMLTGSRPRAGQRLGQDMTYRGDEDRIQDIGDVLADPHGILKYERN